jgi:hypothetical protein
VLRTSDHNFIDQHVLRPFVETVKSQFISNMPRKRFTMVKETKTFFIPEKYVMWNGYSIA